MCSSRCSTNQFKVGVQDIQELQAAAAEIISNNTLEWLWECVSIQLSLGFPVLQLLWRDLPLTPLCCEEAVITSPSVCNTVDIKATAINVNN